MPPEKVAYLAVTRKPDSVSPAKALCEGGFSDNSSSSSITLGVKRHPNHCSAVEFLSPNF